MPFYRSGCQYELRRPGDYCVCVVANSPHGTQQRRIPVAVDLFLTAIAESAGFEIERLLLARQLRRRDRLNRFLRETVIVLRRPA